MSSLPGSSLHILMMMSLSELAALKMRTSASHHHEESVPASQVPGMVLRR
jgi:hypothetical protein